MPLFVPPSVARELRERTMSFREDVLRSCDLDDTDPRLIEMNRVLHMINRRLLLVRARERVVPGVPMKPGYYHLLVDGDADTGAPISVTVIEGKDGEFVEPTSRVFEKLAAGDMRERRNLERFKKADLDEWVRNEAEKARDAEERREDVKDRVNAYTRTSVSMNQGTPWTQNAQPNALRARDEKKKKGKR